MPKPNEVAAYGLAAAIEKSTGNTFQLQDVLGFFIPFFLPIIQRGDDDFRIFGVGMMDGLRIMPQSLLREPFGIAALQRPFRPCVTVAVGIDRVSGRWASSDRTESEIWTAKDDV